MFAADSYSKPHGPLIEEAVALWSDKGQTQEIACALIGRGVSVEGEHSIDRLAPTKRGQIPALPVLPSIRKLRTMPPNA